MPSREPEVGSLKNFPMERPPEPPAAFVSCQRSAFSGRLTPNAGHLPLNESAPWAAGTGSPAGIPYGVGVYGSPATAGTELTEKTVLGTFSPMSDKDAVGASRRPALPGHQFFFPPFSRAGDHCACAMVVG